MSFTDALGDAWDNTVDAVTNPAETFTNVAQDLWQAQKNFASNISEKVDIPRLVDAVKDGSPSEVFNWGKENANGGLVPLVIDGIFDTNVSKVTSAFTKNLGDTLVDDSINSLVDIAGLAQGGLEKIGLMPDLKQIDELTPTLDLYEDPNFDEASTAETIAGRAGQITGLAAPFIGTAGLLLKGGRAAVSAFQNGHSLTSVADKTTDVVSSARTAIPSSAKPVTKAADEADNAIPASPWPAQSGTGKHARPDGNFELQPGQVYFDTANRPEIADFVRVDRIKNTHALVEDSGLIEPGVALRPANPIGTPGRHEGIGPIKPGEVLYDPSLLGGFGRRLANGNTVAVGYHPKPNEAIPSWMEP